MSLSADLTVRFSPPGGQPLAIEQDNRDAGMRLPFISAPPPAVTAQELAQEVGWYWKPVRPLRYGRHVLRVYHDAALDVRLQTLDPTGGWDEDPVLTFWGVVIARFPGSGHDGRDVVDRGRRQDTVREIVRFNGQAEAQVRYWYGSPQVTVRATSDFIDADGNTMPTPAPRSYGRFRAERPAYGALAVEYVAEYTEWWVYYDIDPLAMPYEIVELLRADGTPYGRDVRWPWADQQARVLPELTVIATWRDQMAEIALPREFADYRFSLSWGRGKEENDDDRLKYTETEREKSLVRVENPDDPSQYVDVERVKEIKLKNARGEIITLLLNPA